MAERLEEEVVALRVGHVGGANAVVTVSIGLATVVPLMRVLDRRAAKAVDALL